MNYRHDPEAFFSPRDDDGTGYRDGADLAFALDRRDDSDACALCATESDE